MQQLTTDLRARFADVIESERQAEEADAKRATAHAPAQPIAAGAPRWLTTGRVELVRKMLAERYPAQEAAERFAAIKWDGMTLRAYQAGIDRLKGVPRIDRHARPVPVQSAPAVQVTVPLIEGKFTVSFEDGSHKTLRVRRQREDAKFKPGELLVGHLVGPDNDNDYTNVGHVTPSGGVSIWRKHQGNERLAEAIRVLVGDPKAAATAYAEKSGNCAACGRTLTAPVEENPFRAVGLGPECGKKAGW